MTDLERIEARYAADAEGFEPIPPPGTVVKLARALDEIRKAHAPSGPRQRCLNCTSCGAPVPDGGCCWQHDLAERTLHEVAGGDDA